MDFVQKKHPQIPQIQHSTCKVVNTYISARRGIDSWSFVKRFTSASVEVPPKKALRWRWCLWNARIARNNYGSVPISSGGELLPYLCLEGGRHVFWRYVLVRQKIYRIFQSDLVALFALWVGFLSPNFLGDSNLHGETMPWIARDEFQQTNLSPNFPHWIYDNYWLKYWRHKSAVPTG